jgi:hypothetical protein
MTGNNSGETTISTDVFRTQSSCYSGVGGHKKSSSGPYHDSAYGSSFKKSTCYSPMLPTCKSHNSVESPYVNQKQKQIEKLIFEKVQRRSRPDTKAQA